jgi:DUF1016 N-terminal domain
LKKTIKKKSASASASGSYARLVSGISDLLETARRTGARTINALMTATYWEIGRRIVEFEQGGEKRAEYGKAVLERLSNDLTARYGRGFARPNLIRFRQFYSAFPDTAIRSTLSNESIDAPDTNRSTALNRLEPRDLARAFPLPWSSYVLLISRARSPEAFVFYHSEALRGGWSVRQLQRQMDSQFYERAALSRNKAAILSKGSKRAPGDITGANEEIRHPLVLEFLGLRDEYSESDLEDAHWVQPGENPPVGVVLCSGKGEALVHYATTALPTKLLVREYLTALPDESVLAAELENTRRQIEARK